MRGTSIRWAEGPIALTSSGTGKRPPIWGAGLVALAVVGVTIQLATQHASALGAVADHVAAVPSGDTYIRVTGNDKVGTASVSVSLENEPRNGIAWVDGNLVGYRPFEGYDGTDAFFYRITDELGHTSIARVTITISPSDAQPRAERDQVSVPSGESLPIDVLANDVLGDEPAEVHLVGGPSFGVASVDGLNQVVFTAPLDFSGHIDFSYQLIDADGDFSIATVSVVVECPGCAKDTLTISWDPPPEPVAGYRVMCGPSREALDIPVAELQVDENEPFARRPHFTFSPSTDLGIRPGGEVCIKVGAVRDARAVDWSRPLCVPTGHDQRAPRPDVAANR